MHTVGNDDVDALADFLAEYIGAVGGEDPRDIVKDAIGRYLGIRTEDGEQRVYLITMLEGEPYVMDGE